MGFDEAWDSTPAQNTFDAAWGAVPDASAPSTPSFLESVGSGIMHAPGAAFDAVASIPSGISNIYNTFRHPVESLDNGTTEKTARGTGSLAAGLAGAGAGALLGPVGAVAGGAAGLLGFDWINQLTGSDAATTPEQDSASLGQNIGTGLVLGAAGKLAETGINKIASSVPKIASAIDRKSLSTRQSDYGKASDLRTIETPDGDIKTYVRAALDDLTENNKLGKSRNPVEMLKNVDAETTALQDAIGTAIKDFDSTPGTPAAIPDFSRSRAYVKSGNVPANEVPEYIKQIDDLENAIYKQGGGSLDYLQKQKQALGDSWDPADKIKSNFGRALYTDLKTSIEKYVPEVKGLNAELAKYKTVEPILNRSLKALENKSPLTTLRDVGYTTGGIGAPTLLGASLGGPAGAVVGAGVGLTGKFLASPTGQALVARGLRNVGGAADSVANVAAKIPENVIVPTVQSNSSINSAFSSNSDSKSTAIESTFSKGGKMKSEEAIAAIKSDPYTHAVAMTESSMNPKAKNPESSAGGLFQFVDATAKSLGLKDRFDPAQSLEAFNKLKAADETYLKNKGIEVDDPQLRYAAHVLGGPLLVKVLEGKTLNDKEKRLVENFKENSLPKFIKNLRVVSA